MEMNVREMKISSKTGKIVVRAESFLSETFESIINERHENDAHLLVDIFNRYDEIVSEQRYQGINLVEWKEMGDIHKQDLKKLLKSKGLCALMDNKEQDNGILCDFLMSKNPLIIVDGVYLDYCTLEEGSTAEKLVNIAENYNSSIAENTRRLKEYTRRKHSSKIMD